jgi:hypothetical protein
MIRLILLSAAAIPVAVALSSQRRSASEPAGPLAEAALEQQETPASIWWADYDGDGLEDALAITRAGAPQLLRNLGDGEFTNVTRSAGLAGVSNAGFATWGDIDGDGAPDLYVGTATGPKLFVNQRGGAFVEAAARSGLGHTSADLDAHFLDYDHDSQLDLHVQTAAGDLLYRGVGAGQFQRVELGLPTAAAGTAVVAHAHENELTHAAPAPSTTGEGDQAKGAARTTAATGGAAARGGSSTANPVTTRQPAPNPPGSYASVPCAFVNASASSVFDQTTNQCLLASSQGTLGNLYPLSNDFNVNAAGNVGIGINNAADRLHVNNGDIRVTGSAGREVVLYDGAGQVAVRLDANATGSSNNIQLLKDGKVANQFAPAPEGYIERTFHAASGNAVLARGVSDLDASGFLEVKTDQAVTTVRVDSDADDTANGVYDGLVQIGSTGGGVGGTLRVDDDAGNARAVITGEGFQGAATLELFNSVDSRTMRMNGANAFGGGDLFMFNHAGIETIDIDSGKNVAGVIELGNGITSVAKVVLDGGSPSDHGGSITVRAADGSETVHIDGEADNNGGRISVRNDTSQTTIRLVGDNHLNSGGVSMFSNFGPGFEAVTLNAVDGAGTGAELLIRDRDGTLTFDLDGDLGSSAGLTLYETDGSRFAFFHDNVMVLFNSAGVSTITMNGETGGKSAVQSTDSYGQRLLYCMESPEVWFEDVGGSRLVNGSVRVDLDPVFLETVTIDESNPMRVFITLNGDNEGVWIEKGDSYFVVHERSGGTSNVSFDWRLLAKRRGLESFRLDPYVEDLGTDGDEPSERVMRAPQDGEDKVEQEVSVRRPDADERGSAVDDNTVSREVKSVDAPERQ